MLKCQFSEFTNKDINTHRHSQSHTVRDKFKPSSDCLLNVHFPFHTPPQKKLDYIAMQSYLRNDEISGLATIKGMWEGVVGSGSRKSVACFTNLHAHVYISEHLQSILGKEK